MSEATANHAETGGDETKGGRGLFTPPPQGHTPDPHTVPVWALWSALVLIVATLSFAAMARYADVGSLRMPPATAVETRLVAFETGGDETVVVTDMRTGATIARLAPDEAGFVSGMLRGLHRERRMRGAAVSGSGAAAYRIDRSAEGRLTLTDLATERRIELGGFGRTHYETFMRLLRDGGPRT